MFNNCIQQRLLYTLVTVNQFFTMESFLNDYSLLTSRDQYIAIQIIFLFKISQKNLINSQSYMPSIYYTRCQPLTPLETKS